MQKIDWNEKVKEALERTEFMALATLGDDGSWTNPVAFAYNEKMDLYFISMTDSKHTQNILANPNVSAAIFKTERFSEGDVMGLQLKGIASHLTAPEDIKEAARHYLGRSPSNNEFRASTSEKGGVEAFWQFFKVTPTEAWCFDSRIFGEKRERVDLRGLNLDVKQI